MQVIDQVCIDQSIQKCQSRTKKYKSSTKENASHQSQKMQVIYPRKCKSSTKQLTKKMKVIDQSMQVIGLIMPWLVWTKNYKSSTKVINQKIDKKKTKSSTKKKKIQVISQQSKNASHQQKNRLKKCKSWV